MRLLGMCVLALVLAGCGSSPPPPAPHLTASTTQFRPDEGTRNLRTGVTNTGHSTLDVQSASLSWSGFSRNVVPVRQSVGPGDSAAFDMAYGDARCDSRPTDRPRLWLTVDGVGRTFALKVEDSGLLDRLWAKECAARRLDAAASIELLAGRLGKDGYHTDILLTRRSGSTPVSAIDVRGSVILEVLPASHLPLRLSGSASSLRVPVLIRTSLRCDPHALGQSQQTFLLSIFVRLADEPTQRVILPLTPSLRASLQSMIDRDCT